MRKLYLVPIIHTGSDMGSIAASLEEKAVATVGDDEWRHHKEVVTKFWDSIADFFHRLDVSGFKIYQDGMVADLEAGRRIVEEGARNGSTNYRIVSELLGRGALLVKTEDVSLVKKEYRYIKDITGAKSSIQRETAALRYRLAQKRLLEERDKLIVANISSTLHEGETGVLFVGAYHDVLSKLPPDICVVQVKEADKVREYYGTVTNVVKRKPSQHLQQLAEYLMQPVVTRVQDP